MIKIQFIDDDAMTLQMLTKAAEMSGFEVLSNTSASAGFALAIEQQPDVLILDYNMPEKNGVDLLKEIRAHPKTAAIPVLMLSASPNVEIIDAFYAAGGQKYITKPIRLTEFFEVIREHTTK